ncbi:ASCH domain-containing protein [Pseudogemmobacter bohemicus]|uniref:ASCH domain-containing protein n=1 Tax=Pseudogemmobacter bohemicus TaxID=2250708 RepID=UPI000DD4E9A9|nr:ASCH domain-containing protein [Pseudogemmobacter bohemicus]
MQAYPDLPKLALSVRQPWIWAMFNAGKDIENRSWPTKVRGLVCLHAAKGMTGRDIGEFEGFFGFDLAGVPADYSDLPRGGIVGVVEIVDCVSESRSKWFFGAWGFVLRNARPVALIPVKGELGFFDWRRNLPAEGVAA